MADELYVALLEIGVAARELDELGGANRGEVGGMESSITHLPFEEKLCQSAEPNIQYAQPN